MTDTARQIDTLAAFIPELIDHIADSGLTLTTTGITIVNGWDGWTLTAHACDADGNEVPFTFTAAEAIEHTAA
jgi:hypothetical protein